MSRKEPINDNECSKVADTITTGYLKRDYNWQDPDFRLLTTIRYDPSLYKGRLQLIDAVFENPLDSSFFYLLDNHIRRLNLERDFFEFNQVDLISKDTLLTHITKAMVEDEIDMLSPYKVRVLVSSDSKVQIDFKGPIDFNVNNTFDTPISFDAYLDSQPTIISPFTSFKTTRRNAYEDAKKRVLATKKGKVDVILYNSSGNVTESSFCNVGFQRKIKNPITGRSVLVWVTPPLSAGCIEGTYRKWLMDNDLIHEQSIPIKQLRDGETIILFNSVRGILKARLHCI